MDVWWTFNGEILKIFPSKDSAKATDFCSLRAPCVAAVFYTHRRYFHSFKSIASTWSKRPEHRKTYTGKLYLEIKANEWNSSSIFMKSDDWGVRRGIDKGLWGSSEIWELIGDLVGTWIDLWGTSKFIRILKIAKSLNNLEMYEQNPRGFVICFQIDFLNQHRLFSQSSVPWPF